MIARLLKENAEIKENQEQLLQEHRQEISEIMGKQARMRPVENGDMEVEEPAPKKVNTRGVLIISLCYTCNLQYMMLHFLRSFSGYALMG